MNNPRHIKILRDLKVSEMSDEEILKVAVDRLDAKAGIFIYQDVEEHVYWFSRWKTKHGNGGYHWCKFMMKTFEHVTGIKMNIIKEPTI